MGPFERVRARASAIEILKLSSGADGQQVRRAWRRAAFDSHPDRHGGDQSEFIRAKAAFDFLINDEAGAFCQSAVAAQAADRIKTTLHTSPARPSVRVSAERFGERAVTECRAGLRASGVCSARIRQYGCTSGPVSSRFSFRVARAIQRRGRNLSYLVAEPLTPGTTHVELPNTSLCRRAETRPIVIAVEAGPSPEAEAVIPRAAVSRLFLDVTSVQIRFGAIEEIDRIPAEG